MNKIIQNLRRELKQNIDLNFKKGAVNFFNEPIKVYGVRSQTVHKIAQKYFNELKNNQNYFRFFKRSSQKTQVETKPKKNFFDFCEKMLKSDYHEETIIVCVWADKLKKYFDVLDFKIFELWLKKYFNNWGKVDSLCPHTINYFVKNYPEVIPKIKKWTDSKNRWMRRAAAVSFISGSRDFPQKKHLPDIFWIAKKLLKDDDDLVQKGYGWMLKRAAENYQKEVFNFVFQYKCEMPRTALRYAIEKMPKNMKIKAME